MMGTWFPGAPRPLPVSLQLEVDGQAWGSRFDSTITLNYYMSKQLLAPFKVLAGCKITAFRRRPSVQGLIPAIDLIISSLAGRLPAAAVTTGQGVRAADSGCGRARMGSGSNPSDEMGHGQNQLSDHKQQLRQPQQPQQPQQQRPQPPQPQRRPPEVPARHQHAPEGQEQRRQRRQQRKQRQPRTSKEEAATGAVFNGERSDGAGGYRPCEQQAPEAATQGAACGKQQQGGRGGGHATESPAPPLPAAHALPRPVAGATAGPSSNAPEAKAAGATPGAHASSGGAGAQSASLAALQLREILQFDIEDGATAAAKAATAVAAVLNEVGRAADALGLPEAQLHAVLAAVDAATAAPLGCHRFVVSDYRRLRRACCKGEVGLARAWMEGMAARASSG
jgi:hypothetical protein